MRLGDLTRIGFLPLQDHDPDQQTHGRLVLYACRVESTVPLDADDGRIPGDVAIWGHEGASGRTGEQSKNTPDKSAGDVMGGFLVLNETGKREIPGWSFALPCVTIEDLPAPSSEATRAAGPRTVRVRPVGGTDFAADDRFREIVAEVPPGTSGLPKGTAGVVLTTTEETTQRELFLPTAGGADLIAVNANPQADAASLVYDLDAAGNPDPARSARLHSAWRVMRLPGGADCQPAAAGALAWQLTTAGQDGIDGGGLVVDQSAGRGPGVEDQDELTAPPEPTPERPQTGPAADQATDETVIGYVLDYRPQQTQTRPAGTPGTSSAGTLNPIGPSIPGGQLTGAFGTARRGGPFEVGHAEDAHRIAVDADGNPINALHLSPAALWYMDRSRDGPLDFTALPYSAPNAGPFQAPTTIAWDAGSGHNWGCDSGTGRFRLFTRVPLYIPDPPPGGDPPPKKKQPPPFQPPPGGEDGDPDTGGIPFLPEYTNPQPQGGGEVAPQPKRPAWVQELEERLGLQPGSVDVDGIGDLPPETVSELEGSGVMDAGGAITGPGAVPLQDEPTDDRDGEPCATFVACVHAPGFKLKAFNPTAGADDLRRAGGNVPIEKLRENECAPETAQFVPFAAQEGGTLLREGGGACLPGRPSYPTLGGCVLLPAGVDAAGFLRGDYDTGTPASELDPPVPAKLTYSGHTMDLVLPSATAYGELARIKIGQPTTGGAVKSGGSIGVSSGKLTLQGLDANGEAGDAYLEIDSAGDAPNVGGGLAITSAITSRPASITSAGYGVWVDSGTDTLYYYDGSTDYAIPGTGSGSLAATPGTTGFDWYTDPAGGSGGQDVIQFQPGITYDADTGDAIEITALTEWDWDNQHGSGDGLATLNGWDERGLDNADSITASQSGTTLTASASVFTALGKRASGETVSSNSGTSLKVNGLHEDGLFAVGDMVGSATTYGFRRITAISFDRTNGSETTDLTLNGSLPGGNMPASTALEIIESPTLRIEDGGDFRRVDRIESNGTGITMPNSQTVGAGATLTTGQPGAGSGEECWTYLWAVSNGTTGGILRSTQRTNLLAAPSGYNRKRLIGYLPPSSSGVEQWHGSPSTGVHTYGESLATSTVLSAGTSTTAADVDLSSFVPPGVRSCLVNWANGGTANAYLRTRAPAPTTNTTSPVYAQSGANATVAMETDGAGFLEYNVVTGGSAYLYFIGFKSRCC